MLDGDEERGWLSPAQPKYTRDVKNSLSIYAFLSFFSYLMEFLELSLNTVMQFTRRFLCRQGPFVNILTASSYLGSVWSADIHMYRLARCCLPFQ